MLFLTSVIEAKVVCLGVLAIGIAEAEGAALTVSAVLTLSLLLALLTELVSLVSSPEDT